MLGSQRIYIISKSRPWEGDNGWVGAAPSSDGAKQQQDWDQWTIGQLGLAPTGRGEVLIFSFEPGDTDRLHPLSL
uniref:Uncharacterized protein n=1 Tax=Anguilla anguilla TaxID=7936 RepID=A0A0E9Q5D3_ANGAN